MDPTRQAFLDELYAHGREHDERLDDRLERFRNVEPETAELLGVLVRSMAAQRVLEIGTSNGYSTIWLGDAAEAVGGTVLSLEIEAERTAQAADNLAEAGVADFVELRTADAGEALRSFADGGRTLAFLGASGVGKSTLVNALLGAHVQATTEVRTGDDRGRHTTVAAELLPLPNGGWLVDTPGIRALSLWLSGDGIERAFADVFDLMEHCRFRDCKHDQEPGCAVRAAIADGALDPDRFASLERLVAEEVALEAEQRARTKTGDRRRGGRPPPEASESADSEDPDDPADPDPDDSPDPRSR